VDLAEASDGGLRLLEALPDLPLDLVLRLQVAVGDEQMADDGVGRRRDVLGDQAAVLLGVGALLDVLRGGLEGRGPREAATATTRQAAQTAPNAKARRTPIEMHLMRFMAGGRSPVSAACPENRHGVETLGFESG
jgi:hypothetical protein